MDAAGSKYLNAYALNDNLLKEIAHNTNMDTPEAAYEFEFDDLGTVTGMKVGDEYLSKNRYTSDQYHLLTESEYIMELKTRR